MSVATWLAHGEEQDSSQRGSEVVTNKVLQHPSKGDRDTGWAAMSLLQRLGGKDAAEVLLASVTLLLSFLSECTSFGFGGLGVPSAVSSCYCA